MAFKMNGSPAKMGTISGTAGHGSALKMKAEADAASALKQKEERETSWWKGEEGIIPDELQPGVNRPKVKTEHGKNVEAEKKATKEEKRKSEKTKYGTKTYKAAYDGPDKSKYKTQGEFNKAADDWWASDAGQKKASAKGSKFAHRIIKKGETVETKPKGTTTRKSDGATVTKGLGAQKGKTLTYTDKQAEKVKIEKANTQIKEGKKEGGKEGKNKRDAGQLEKGEIRSGRDNKKTGTVVSRWFGKQKVKRNKRQLAKRNAGKETNGTTSGS